MPVNLVQRNLNTPYLPSRLASGRFPRARDLSPITHGRFLMITSAISSNAPTSVGAGASQNWRKDHLPGVSLNWVRKY